MFQSALLILLALVVLSILILIHEFGHFLAAKLSGVWVEEFGIGLPPTVFKKKFKGTIYSINLLPIGGFVRLHGEVDKEEPKYPKKAYVNKGKPARLFIALAGVFMNFVLTVVLFSAVYFFTGLGRGVRVNEVLPGSSAESAGFVKDDIIKSIGGVDTNDFEKFQQIVEGAKGKTTTAVVERTVKVKNKEALQEKTLTITLPKEASPQIGLLGVVYSPIEIYRPPLFQRPIIYTIYGYNKTIFLGNKMLQGFATLFTELSKGKMPQGVAGPIGVTALVAGVAQNGLLPLLEFSGFISLNLALINLVPFPPLDGSRVIFITTELFLGKNILRKIETHAYTVGMIILLAFMLVVSVGEIPRLISAGSLNGFINSLIQ